jgi:hypothetical protein
MTSITSIVHVDFNLTTDDWLNMRYKLKKKEKNKNKTNIKKYIIKK